MSSEWFCRIMGDEWGPMSADELIAVARWGRLSRDDVVRNGLDGTWVRAEIVEGLFEDHVPQSPVGVKPNSRSGRHIIPAKRSVKSTRRARFWVNMGNSIQGPFGSEQLRKLAEQGQLKPNHPVSSDRFRWFAASQIKELMFGGADPQSGTLPDSAANASKPQSTRERRKMSRRRAVELTKSVATGGMVCSAE